MQRSKDRGAAPASEWAQRISAWLEVRTAPVVATMAILVLGMAFTLLWHSLLHGGPLKVLSAGDIWSLAQSSSALLHGHFGAIYFKDSALTSPPALELVLAPVIGLGQLVGLAPHVHGGGEPIILWFLLGPASILIGSSALFAVDAVARYWAFRDRTRLALALVGGAGVANVVIDWGHPEDCASLALVLWAALAVERGGTAGTGRAAWLLGLAIAFQPLAILGVVPVLIRAPWRTWAALAVRLVLPSLVLLAGPLIASGSHTLFVQLRQPFQTQYVAHTPWTRWAPRVGRGLRSGGPTRAVSSAIGVALAIVVCRKRHDLPTVLSVLAVAFFLRVLLEVELNWYYLWPLAALSLLLALRLDLVERGVRARVPVPVRFVVSALALLATMVLGDHRFHDVDGWWLAMMAACVLMVGAAVPWRVLRGGPDGVAIDAERGGEPVSAH